jgi:serine/threonine protein kinase
MPLAAGTRLGTYEILDAIGAGGMGEVYRARDAKLDRDVALKVLPEGVLSDESARRSFQREARALSRLSHPHVATVYDFDTANGMDFLVMELVRGPSLRDRLREKGPLPEKHAIRLGTQLARGLQAAHEEGIVHRDLKPGNLHLTPDGLLKILDFGLARLPKRPASQKEDAPTQTMAGKVLGTLPYMPPEQCVGRGVDARTDLYAAGAVLYEMVTGQRLFSRPSHAELVDAILHDEPVPPRNLNERLSPRLEAVILKALDKDPELRHQTAKDLLVDLERVQLIPSSMERSPLDVGPGTRRRRRLVVLAALPAALLLSGLVWMARPLPAPRVLEVRPVTRGLGAALPEALGSPSWATDGERLYYLSTRDGRAHLTQTPVTGGEPREIQVGPHLWMAIEGYFRSQGSLLAIGTEHPESLDAEDAGMPVWLIPAPGGAGKRIGTLLAWSAAAAPDEQRIAIIQGGYNDRRLGIANLDGSGWQELVRLPTGAVHLRWEPTGDRLRFDGKGPPGHEGEAWIWETSSSGDTPRPLWPGMTGNWVAGGRYFVFSRAHDISSFAPRIDLYAVRERGWLSWAGATPVQLTAGPVGFLFPGPSRTTDRFFSRGEMAHGELLRWNRETRRLESFLDGASAQHVVASPDGQWLAWSSYPDGLLWKGRSDGSARQQLTGQGRTALFPSWSPDGRELVFVGRAGDEIWFSLQRISADGTDREVLARADEVGHYWSPCWLPDGDKVLFSRLGGGEPGVYRLDLRSRTVSLLPGSERLRDPTCSVQGHVLASEQPLQGAEPGFKVLWKGQSEWEEVGPRGWVHPHWTRDGRSLMGLRSDPPQIERFDFQTGKQAVVLKLEGTPLVATAIAPWMGLAADDSPLVLREEASRDLYSIEWDAP